MKYVLRQPRMTKKSFVATSPSASRMVPGATSLKETALISSSKFSLSSGKRLNICFLYSGIMRMKSNFLPYGLR